MANSTLSEGELPLIPLRASVRFDQIGVMMYPVRQVLG